MKNKRRPELKEFDVDKYAALEDFFPDQWAHLIESRLRIGQLLKTGTASYAKVDPALTPIIKQWLDEPDDSKFVEYFEKFQIFMGFGNASEIARLLKCWLKEPDDSKLVEYAQQFQLVFSTEFSNDSSLIDKFNSSLTDALLERFWDFPLKPISKSTLSFTNNQMQRKIGAVVPLTGITVMALQRAVLEMQGRIPDVENDVSNSDASYFEWQKNSEQPIDKIVEESNFYKIRHMATVSVDLRRSDQDIRDDFNYLLKEYRTSTGIEPPTITNSRLQRWFENKVLPYADLMLWSEWSGINLSDDELINLLLPDKIANKPLKGTKDGYADAFTWQTLSALANSAANS